MKEKVEALQREIGESEERQSAPADVQNGTLIATIQERYATKFAEVRAQTTALSKLFDADSLRTITEEIAKWQTLKMAHSERYEGAKTRATANQHQLTRMQEIERRVAELKRLQMAKRNALAALGETDAIYAAHRTKWEELLKKKVEELRVQCLGFSSLSLGLIQADIKGGLDTEALKRRFKDAFSGLNIKEQKIDDVCQVVAAAADPFAAWNAVLAELEKLALHKLHGTDAQAVVPETPILTRCRVIETEKARLVAGFDSAKWLELSLAELEVNPVFRYCTNEDTNEYIDFADASAGQQATALLTVLLNQEGAPLIIDQPEDDVDSKMSPDIVRQIWKAKSSRQLIFASHNANFVVNGDAELVICCDYVRAGDQTGGQIKATGAIDNKAIKEEITLVTEGGKAAFNLRKEKYGF
jgi:type III restriction enzyme